MMTSASSACPDRDIAITKLLLKSIEALYEVIIEGAVRHTGRPNLYSMRYFA